MLKRLRQQTRQQSGFNLIEAAIVLGIVGLIVGGIWAAASSAYENMRQQTASKQLLALVQNVRNFYAQAGTDTFDNSVANIVNLGLAPNDMVINASGTPTLRHQWGSTVTFTTTAVPNYATFGVVFNNLKRDQCANLLSRVANAARGSGLLIVTNGTANVLDLSTNASNTLPASTTCAASASPEFVFSLR